jgi:hypothetical protein
MDRSLPFGCAFSYKPADSFPFAQNLCPCAKHHYLKMSLVVPEAHQQFQHILRLLNTNVDGKRKIMYALTEIKGVGRRYSNLVCKKADVDLNKRFVSPSPPPYLIFSLYMCVHDTHDVNTVRAS